MIFSEGWRAGFDAWNEAGEYAKCNEADVRPKWNACPTDPADREAGSLHKISFAIMRYNKINTILRACAEPRTAQRTQKIFYVKAWSHEGGMRLPVGRLVTGGEIC